MILVYGLLSLYLPCNLARAGQYILGDLEVAKSVSAGGLFNVDSVNGRVGVGIASPGRKLSVVGGAANTYLQVTNATVGTGSSNGLELYMLINGNAGIISRETGFLRIEATGGHANIAASVNATMDAGNNVYMDAGSGIIAFQENGTTGAFYRLSTGFAQMVLAVNDNVGNQFILTNYDLSHIDHDHATQANPTFYVHSDTSPSTSNDEWVSLTHDKTDAVFGLGSGDYTFPDGGLIPKKVVADPCGTMSEGSIFYNDTSNYMCYCDGTNDVKMHDPTAACF